MNGTLRLTVPTIYVVPHELFHRRRGLNVAECEFPAYYNFFLLRRRIRLVIDDASVEARVRAVFQESLFGPTVAAPDLEFDDDYPHDIRPDIRRDHASRGDDGTVADRHARHDAGAVGDPDFVADHDGAVLVEGC